MRIKKIKIKYVILFKNVFSLNSTYEYKNTSRSLKHKECKEY